MPKITHDQFLQLIETRNLLRPDAKVFLIKGQVYKSRHGKLKWRCDSDHEWEAAASNVIYRQSGCNICSYAGNSIRVIKMSKSPDQIHSEVQKSNIIFNRNIQWVGIERKDGKRNSLWKCECGHEWEARLADILNGHGCPQCAKNIRKQTCLKRYGVESHNQSNIIKEKKRQSYLIKYGVDNPTLRHIPKESLDLLNDPAWLIEQHHNQQKSLEQIATELGVMSYITVGNRCRKFGIEIKLFKQSYKCEIWLNRLAIATREYQIPDTKYIVDGFDQETNTIYEFYGDYWHGNPKIYCSYEIANPNTGVTFNDLYKKTMDRERDLISLGYNIISIWESEFDRINGVN